MVLTQIKLRRLWEARSRTSRSDLALGIVAAGSEVWIASTSAAVKPWYPVSSDISIAASSLSSDGQPAVTLGVPGADSIDLVLDA